MENRKTWRKVVDRDMNYLHIKSSDIVDRINAGNFHMELE